MDMVSRIWGRLTWAVALRLEIAGMGMVSAPRRRRKEVGEGGCSLLTWAQLSATGRRTEGGAYLLKAGSGGMWVGKAGG